MSSSAEAGPTQSAKVVSHFFCIGEKCEKPLDKPHPAKPLGEVTDEDLEENFVDANKNKSINDLRRSPLREALSWGKTM